MDKPQTRILIFWEALKRNKIHLVLILLGAILPLILIIFLINRYAVNVPVGDDWAMVPIFQHIDHGTFSLHDIWAQHNEHRIFFPLLAIIALAYTTHWHLGAQMIASILISTLSLGIILLLTWRTTLNKWVATITSVVISIWFYGTVQWENWLWGWQIEWFMCVFAVLLAFYLTFRANETSSNRSLIYFIASILAAILASFSLGSGILVWPIVFVWLILAGNKRYYKIWGTVGLVALAAYYFHYVKPANSPSVLYSAHHPKLAIQYLMIYLGRPMSDQLNAAATWGGLFLALLIVLLGSLWIKRKDLGRFLPWLAILTFSLAAGALTTVSRVGFGLDQAGSSRYTTISLLFIISMFGIIGLLISLNEKEPLKLATLVMVVLSIPLLVSMDVQGLQGFRDRSAYLKTVKTCSHEMNPTKECLLVAIPGQGLDRASLQYIKNKHWGGY
jgi:hypothetical protein